MPRQNLPDVDPRRCTTCGDCVRVCPTDCLTVRGHVPVVAPHLCIGCTVCEIVCPVAAIAMRLSDW